MLFLKSVNWIGPRTRHVQVGFNSFNGNFNHWISNWYIVEMLPNALIQPRLEVNTYRPTVALSTSDGMQLFVLDLIRSALVFYIMTYNLAWEFGYERQPKPKGSGAGWKYFFGPYGLLDLGIIVTSIYVIISRYVNFGD